MDGHRISAGTGLLLFVLLPAIFLVPTVQKTCHCGRTIGNKIIHGEPVARGDFPWMVAIMLANEVPDIYCGGSLVTRLFVLTAYHCAGRDPKEYKLLIGSIHLKDIDSEAKLVNVRKIIRFQPENHDDNNDLALMQLERSVRLSPYIQTICLPPKDAIFSDVQAVVAGWGETNKDIDETGASTYTDYLLSGEVNVTSTENCNEVMARYKRPIPDQLLCAGAYNGQPDHCYGDSGGPLMYFDDKKSSWEIIGTVSSAYKCANPRDYSYYVNVSHFRDWIQDNSNYIDC